MAREHSPNPEEALLTSPGMPVGTAAYMAPEQVRGEETDSRSDLFSLGVVLYEMAAGRPPFEGPTCGVIFEAILNRAPIAPRVWNPALPVPLEGIISKALAKDPSARYQSAALLLADLKQFQLENSYGRLSPLSADPAHPAGEPLRGPAPVSGGQAPPETARPGRRPPRALRLALWTGAAVLMVTAGYMFFSVSRAYFPWIVIGEFRSEGEIEDPGLVEFALRRTLSQFPEITVLDPKEFGQALRLQSQQQAAQSGKQRSPGVIERVLSRTDTAREPALSVSAEIRQSVGGLELNARLVNRGRSESFSRRYRGVNELITRGVDDLAWQLLKSYDPELESRHAASMGSFKPAERLLSHDLDALRHYWRGARAWNHYDMGLAEHEFRSALEIDPTFALARLLLGEVFVFQNQWNAARGEIQAAQEQAGSLTDVDRLRIDALLARASGKIFEERAQLQKLIELQPHRVEYYYELAESYFHTADVQDAISHYQQVLALDDSYALAYNHMGYCLAWQGNHAAALQALNHYLQLDPSTNPYDSLGDAQMLAGNYDQAETMKLNAIERDPTLYYAKRSLVFLDILRGRYRAAREKLDLLLSQGIDGLEKARFLAVEAYYSYRLGQYGAALRACEHGLEILQDGLSSDAPHDELVWLKGLIELGRRNLAGANAAEAQLRRMLDAGSITAMNYKPAYKHWLHLLAGIRAAEGKTDEALSAIRDLEWVKDKLGYWSTPYDYAFMMDSAGRILEQLKAQPDAERFYRAALGYNPHYAPARFHLGNLLLNTGRIAEGRKELEQFLSLWRTADRDAPEILAAGKLPAAVPEPPQEK